MPPLQQISPITHQPILVTIPTLDPQWFLLGLSVTIIVFFAFGLRTFRNRVVS